MAKKKPDRTIFSGLAGPAQLYLFIEIASFTDDWADMKLVTTNYVRSKTKLPAIRREHQSFRAEAVPGNFGVLTAYRAKARAAVTVSYAPFCLFTEQLS